MKKSLLILALLLAGFWGFGQNEMPFILKYQLSGDTVYHNTQSVGGIHINLESQEVIVGENSDFMPLSALDTVYVVRDRCVKYVGEASDWDEVLFSNEQIHFYKGNGREGQPYALFSIYVNDSIPDGYFIYTEFDEEGSPQYLNFNNSCFMVVDTIYGEYFDAVIMDANMSSFHMDSVQMVESLGRVRERHHSLDRLPSAAQAIALQHCVVGGASMAIGGAGMVLGCAMLLPGVNVAVGATIALAGAASFISGALLTTHATDQLLSDGSHTQGYLESSQLFGLAGAVTSGPGLVYFVLEEGLSGAAEVALQQAEINAAYQRAERIRNMNLSITGRAALVDAGSHTVRLYGYIREKLDPNDRFGSMICRDTDALTVEQCQLLAASHPTGVYYCDFSGLEPLGAYYYRSYYYSTELAGYGNEFSPWIVSSKKSFRMPGVVTLDHEQGNSSNSYWLHGAFQDVAGQHTHTVGFCYSYSNEMPTYDDETMEQTVYDNGEFTGHLFLNSEHNCCYYRAYAIIDGQIAYGEIKQLGVAVSTYEPTDVTQTTAMGHGEVVCGDVCDVTERGFCWSTYHNPTTSGPHVVEGHGTGFFDCMMTDLTPGTTYYVRAYAIVDATTVYGNEWPFTTVDHPTVTTYEVTNITSTTALGGGEVECADGCNVTERGVCWSTNHNPTTSNAYASSGTGTGSYTCSITGLDEGIMYYVRAYAIVDDETMYGDEVSFTTLTTPTVTTAQVTNIGQTTATGGGNVTDDGGSPVLERGICWSTSHNPTTSNSHATSGSGTGSFAVNMTGLTAHTTYYVRAYATNSVGTEYGNEVFFTTQQEEPTGDWVDLGLPSGLLWATRNVGANSPEDYGSYFAWAETSPKSVYNWSTYQYCCSNSYNSLTKYCTRSDFGCNGYTDNLTILQPGDDAATANWGGGARMPTSSEWQELDNYCSSVWTTQNGVYGRRFTGPNGNTLFLPAAGYRDGSGLVDAGSLGVYWSSSLDTSNPDGAWGFDFGSGGPGMYGDSRDNGQSVRAVREN